MSASKPAGGGLDAQAAEATTGGVNAIAEVPDAGAACGATAEGLGAPPVELSHGSRSPAQAAGLASRCALIISSKVSGSVSPLAARSLIVKPSSEDGIRFMSNLLTAPYLTGRSKSKSKNWCLCPTPAPCSADCPCAPACPTTPWPSSSQQDRRARTLANECWPWPSPPSSASGAVGGGTRGGQLNQPILPAVEQSGWRTEALPLRTTETADLATALSAQRSTCHCYMSVCTCGVTQGLPQVTRPKGTGKLSRGETSLLHS